ncbi:hypothetical protein COT48_05120 [Candidatus Woesearchaeota archaeon CG08_land_8_20_14_0_20_47_9]|nr:MAG: hypothetical protein COT48_05120 [Candidatus Woesearchaeota archaeon CG08_land_8_20_14_0_20_47_9]HII30185.1 glycosyltransferase family 4 protein [Candidatus Woesearchaeota archaeon]
MKILMLNYEFPPVGGGAANECAYILKEFGKRDDLSVDLVTSSANRFEVDVTGNTRIFKLDVHKKDLHYWTMREVAEWSLKAYIFAKRLARRGRYDVCHCWFGWSSGLIGYRLRHKMPYIVALQGSDVPGYSSRLEKFDKLMFKPLSRLVWRHASAVIPNSEGLKELALQTLRCEMEVICNGVDTAQFKPGNKKNSKGKVRLISTGRLIERKGYDYLIKALQGLRNFELTLIGEGDQEERLKNLASSLNVPVNFLGRLEHDEIPAQLQDADVFVLQTLNEGMSNSVLEAMACGLPVVTTDVGGTRELVRQGEDDINNREKRGNIEIRCNGVIVEKGSVESLRAALNRLDRKTIRNMGRKSREIAEEFSWSKMAEGYVEIYEMCLGG